MSKRKEKVAQVAKFGGIDKVADVQMDGFTHEVSTVEVQSKTNLESDTGTGAPAIIRRFVFALNSDAFEKHPPTKQELFNHHLRGIELALWKDGLTIIPGIDPTLLVNDKGTEYQIIVGARPARGNILQQAPQTISEIAHGA